MVNGLGGSSVYSVPLVFRSKIQNIALTLLFITIGCIILLFSGFSDRIGLITTWVTIIPVVLIMMLPALVKSYYSIELFGDRIIYKRFCKQSEELFYTDIKQISVDVVLKGTRTVSNLLLVGTNRNIIIDISSFDKNMQKKLVEFLSENSLAVIDDVTNGLRNGDYRKYEEEKEKANSGIFFIFLIVLLLHFLAGVFTKYF